MCVMQVACSCFFLLPLLISPAAGNDQLKQQLEAKESVVGTLVATAALAHSVRCSDLGKCSSGETSCSVPACGNTFTNANHGFNCTSDYGVDLAMCGGDCPGLIRSIDTTVVRFPPSADFGNGEMQAFVCATKRMEAAFKAAKRTLPIWQYVGSTTGAARFYPGSPQSRADGKCSQYDPRQRPWFLAASSGPKDVVLLIDVSGSMGLSNDPADEYGESRLTAVKRAVTALLRTLSHTDYVAIATFSTDASVVNGQTTLVRATTANVELLVTAVDNLVAGGETRFVKGFNKALPLFRASVEETSKCTRVLLFLTDGETQDSELAVVNAISTEQGLLGANRAHIFTYSMSSDADDLIPKRIACENNGVWARIGDGQDPLHKMAAYYQFLASGIDSDVVRWTTPYVDAFGLGNVVSAARAVYDRTESVPLLTGVVGTDLLIEDLEKYAGYADIIRELIARSSVCPTISLTECQYQFMRLKSLDGYVCPSPQPTIASCSSEVVTRDKCTALTSVNSILCESLNAGTGVTSSPKSNKQVSCCTCDSGSSGGSVVVIVVIVVIIVVVGVVAAVVFLFKRAAPPMSRRGEEGGQGRVHPPPPGGEMHDVHPQPDQEQPPYYQPQPQYYPQPPQEQFPPQYPPGNSVQPIGA